MPGAVMSPGLILLNEIGYTHCQVCGKKQAERAGRGEEAGSAMFK